MPSSWSVVQQAMAYSTLPKPSKPSSPPEPRPFRLAAPEERVSRHPQHPEPPAPDQKSLLSRLWPFKSAETPALVNAGAKDPARGAEAAKRVVKEGVLDQRYKGAARRVTAVMCALPIALYLSYELFERRFMGREQKRRPIVPATPAQAKDTP